MPVRAVVVALVGAVIVGGCTSEGSGQDGRSPGATDRTSPTTAAASESATTAPAEDATSTSPSPTESDPTEATADAVLATGTVRVDGTELLVSGDCDISRGFGQEPVESLDEDEVDVLLTVDNLTGDGSHDGPFAIQVRLLGRGQLVGRTLVSEGAPAPDGATLASSYEGEIEVAELRDRRSREFLDVATLHLEARQQRVAGDQGPRRRDLELDVTCPISRPG